MDVRYKDQVLHPDRATSLEGMGNTLVRGGVENTGTTA